MRNICNVILITFTLLFVSCSDAGLRYLGYMQPSWPSNSMWFNNNHMSVEQNFPIGMRAGQDGNPGVTFRNVFPVTYDFLLE